MVFQQSKLILNPFVISHFSYCTTVWVFYSRRLKNHINNIRESLTNYLLRLHSTFTDLVAKDNSLTIHHTNLQKLVTKMLKVKAGIAPK